MDLTMLGQQIRQARKEEGLTLEGLAEKIGTHKANLSKIERGEQNISYLMLEKIATALNRKVTDNLLIK